MSAKKIDPVWSGKESTEHHILVIVMKIVLFKSLMDKSIETCDCNPNLPEYWVRTDSYYSEWIAVTFNVVA